jgi:hypothetical protein
MIKTMDGHMISITKLKIEIEEPDSKPEELDER